MEDKNERLEKVLTAISFKGFFSIPKDDGYIYFTSDNWDQYKDEFYLGRKKKSYKNYPMVLIKEQENELIDELLTFTKGDSKLLTLLYREYLKGMKKEPESKEVLNGEIKLSERALAFYCYFEGIDVIEFSKEEGEEFMKGFSPKTFRKIKGFYNEITREGLFRVLTPKGNKNGHQHQLDRVKTIIPLLSPEKRENAQKHLDALADIFKLEYGIDY